MGAEAIPQKMAQRLWLATLIGSEPTGGLLDVRYRAKGRPLRRLAFYVIGDPSATMEAIERVARSGDVYVGVAPRRAVCRISDHRPSGGGDAIARVYCLWVDADTPASCDALRAFEPAAALLVNSGNGVHGYWPLRRPLEPEDAKRACRRLAHHLGADMAATDAARIMRPPGTLNWKSDPPQAVVCERLKVVSYSAADIVRHLPDPPCAARRRVRLLRPDGPVVLDGLVRTVSEAEQGNRNAALYWGACRAREHIDLGELDSATAWEALRSSALEVGLGDHEVECTLRSALDVRQVA